MAPGDQQLEKALVSTAQKTFQKHREALTVNAVRELVESELGLVAGFFKSPAWKVKSKAVVQDTVHNLLAAEESGVASAVNGAPETTASPETPNVSRQQKVSANEDNGASKKRKRGRTAVECEDDESVSTGDPNPAASDGDRHEDDSEHKRRKAEAIADDDSSELSDMVDDAPPKNIKTKLAQAATAKRRKSKATAKTAKAGKNDNDSDSSLSSVVEDPPLQSKKRRGGSSSTSIAAAAVSTSPDDAEIKRLQGQLGKCGVRKVWGVELKRFGGDGKAKVRHLKGMLCDVGMEGRFSEARAREIRERRELNAELEDVQAMGRTWGVNRAGRVSRSRAVQSLKEASSDKEEEDEEGGGTSAQTKRKNVEEEDEEDDDEDQGPVVHAKGNAATRRRDDFAFLGSDDDDSD